MNKHFVLFISAVCLFYSTIAQPNPRRKIRYYEVWISSINTGTKQRGILYEVTDSSILISGNVPGQDYSAGTDLLTEFSYRNIDMVKARRVKSMSRGAVAGASIGAVVGLSYGIGLYGDAIIMFGGAPALISMLPAAAFGAGAGALLGSIKDRIPIRSDIKNFDLYKSALQEYSFIQESATGLKRFEHKGFVGMTVGIAFPLTDNSQKGTVFNALAGYRFTKNLGISLTLSDYSYNYDDNSSMWSLANIIAGPLISAPVNSKLRFDFKPGIGYSEAYLQVDEIEVKSGKGLGLDFNASLLFNYSKRGGLLAEAGYFSTKLKYSNNDKEKIGYLYFNIGLVYKFSRSSL